MRQSWQLLDPNPLSQAGHTPAAYVSNRVGIALRGPKESHVASSKQIS